MTMPTPEPLPAICDTMAYLREVEYLFAILRERGADVLIARAANTIVKLRATAAQLARCVEAQTEVQTRLNNSSKPQ